MLNRLFYLLVLAAIPLLPALAQEPARAVLTEEGHDGVRTLHDGTVRWRTATSGDGAPAAEAQIEIPDRGLGVTLTFRRNADAGLRATHIVEIVTELPPGFPGGAIAEIPTLALKAGPEDGGDGLVVSSEKLTDGLIWLSLLATDEAAAFNRALLTRRGWIDLLLLYGNSQRAIVTFPIGDDGRAAIAAMLGEGG